MISIRNLHKTYKLGRALVPVLRGVDLEVRKGELLVILGSSGSGKSTLLHLLGGLDRPDPSDASGKGALDPSIKVDGVELVGLSNKGLDRHRSQTVGFVFQFYHLLPELTVLQNVLLAAMVEKGTNYLGEGGSAAERAHVLLHKVGLDHRLTHKPVELSGGERQRVAIARALINKPPLLLADEPTGNLDSTTGAKVLDTLLELRRDHRQTMVIVTHDAATAARADRVVRLGDGRIVRDADSTSPFAAAPANFANGKPAPALTLASTPSGIATVNAASPTQSPALPVVAPSAIPPTLLPPREDAPAVTAQGLTSTNHAHNRSDTGAPIIEPPPEQPSHAEGSQARVSQSLAASQGPEQILRAVRQALQQPAE